MTDLLPCPFCGSTDLKSGGDDKVVAVWCVSCEASGPNHYGKIEWNTRQAASVERAEVAGEAVGPDDCAEHMLLQARQKGQEQWTNIYAAQLGQFVGYGCEVRALASPPRSEGVSKGEVQSGDAVDLADHDEISRNVLGPLDRDTVQACYVAVLEERCERGTPWDLACTTIARKLLGLIGEAHRAPVDGPSVPSAQSGD